MSRYQTKGSEVRMYALGILIASIMSLFVDISSLIGIAAALFTISFCLDR